MPIHILSQVLTKIRQKFHDNLFLDRVLIRIYISVEGSSTVSRALIAGVVAGCTVLVLGLITVGTYALAQKKRAQRAIEITNPFGNASNNILIYLLSCMTN